MRMSPSFCLTLLNVFIQVAVPLCFCSGDPILLVNDNTHLQMFPLQFSKVSCAYLGHTYKHRLAKMQSRREDGVKSLISMKITQK
jgi:hypothetical protein